ncbi:MAG TPA: hypothetical protein VFU01_14410 [Gemmatimonadaceae bacterium]|nr:hypothetical protein [Gemmatimonadaceae bacterium]
MSAVATARAPAAAADGILREAIDSYHEMLTDDVAADSQAVLDAQIRRRDLYFGDRPLCTVLRPRFMSLAQYRVLQQRGAALLGAFATAHQAAVADRSVRAQFRLTSWEEALVLEDPGFPWPSPVSRLDAFFAGADGLRFTEYNAETPAGPSFNDVLTEVFYALPAVRAFVRRWDVRPLPARHNILHALLTAYEAWSGTREIPRVAVLDWLDVPTRREFTLFQEYAARQGVPCIVADPRSAELRAGTLTLDGTPVDLIYKRVLISELIERCGVEHAVVRAVRERAVCMVNAFACKILHKKASLAVLSDERNAELFTPQQRQVIAANVPWTRVVEERRTAFGGDTVDLIPFIAEHKDQLVLKPNDEYGGKGIVLGWEVDDAAWTEALHGALREAYIVQERVALPSEPYPSVVDGRLHVADRMLDTAPYVVYGQFIDGCLTRLSTAALLNVTAGGGSSVPTWLVEKR